jgi:hypothetical protein
MRLITQPHFHLHPFSYFLRGIIIALPVQGKMIYSSSWIKNLFFLNFQYFLKTLYLCVLKIFSYETRYTWRRIWRFKACP